jgi:hypothetical protein
LHGGGRKTPWGSLPTPSCTPQTPRRCAAYPPCCPGDLLDVFRGAGGSVDLFDIDSLADLIDTWEGGGGECMCAALRACVGPPAASRVPST